MKAHGVDSRTKLIHSVAATPANVPQVLPALLHGGETRVWGDSAYAGQKAAIREAAPRAKDFTQRKGARNRKLNASTASSPVFGRRWSRSGSSSASSGLPVRYRGGEEHEPAGLCAEQPGDGQEDAAEAATVADAGAVRLKNGEPVKNTACSPISGRREGRIRPFPPIQILQSQK